MTQSSTLTYDQQTPHRPTIDELGGGEFKNHPTKPPLDGQPSAEMFNQATKQVVALARLSASIRIQLEFFAGEPAITQLVALGTKLTVDDFQVFDNGDGNTSIVCLQPSKLTPQLMKASGLTVVQDVEVDRARLITEAGGWRVITKLGAVGVDAAVVFQAN